VNVPKTIFRQYDVRGVVDRELTPAFARLLGRAYATAAWEKLGRAPTLAIGRDNRPSGDALARGIRLGVVDTGATAVDVGMLPTPALYFAVHHLSADGGLQVTGSHNPPEFNGFKMVLAGDAIHGDAILDLYRVIVGESWRDGAGQGGERSESGVLDAYRAAIVARHRLARPVDVVVDCGNGVASLVATSTLEALGCRVTGLFCESDGTFPHHHPDPTVPENLADLVREVRRRQAELGIAFDGDGDRIGAVDETGRILFGDQLLVVLGRDAVRRFGPGVPVIFDVKCSEVLPRALAAAGARPEMWKTGHSLIKARMKELQAPLAGEMSGHLFFAGDYFGFDDALFAAARLLEIVAAGPAGLSRLLADLPPTHATPEIRVDCPDELKFGVVERAARHFAARYAVNTIDGVRIAYPDGWALLRASNTQPVLVMRFEATSPEALAAYRTEMTTWLAEQAVSA
jgi:phosphomannomutase/phosphoglucomutase